MCGIFAAINLDTTFTSANLLEFRKATQIVSYRGPDSTANTIFANGIETKDPSNFNIYLGHNRLSIIDLSSMGNQPMLMNDIALIFNGEIFNYIEIKRELIALGHEFKTQTDTEVIIKTYLQFGEKGFAKFNGMWAFVLYDKRKNLIVVSKDRFSIKPLYYLKTENKLYFASEIKQLLSLNTGVKINKQKILTFLQQSLLDYDSETFYQNIHKIPAKQNWVIDLTTKKINEEIYWDYSFSNEKLSQIDATEKFYSLFDQSIQFRLRGDVKVGSLLSGGLDSSSITTMAKKHQSNFRSFSAIFDNKRYSEKKHIDKFTEKSGIQNSSYSFTAQEVIANVEKTMYHQEQPFVSFSVVCQNLLFERIKKETDVVCLLCGQGADEILMGYLKYYYFSLNHSLKNLHLVKFSGNLFGSMIYRTAIANFNFSYAKRYMPFLRQKKSNYLLQHGELEKIWSSADLRKRQTLDVDKFSVPILNHYEDRNSMANSLEVRLPFLDHELVDFCISLPYSLKVRNGWTKYIMRKAMHEVPHEIRWRRDKEGFVSPEVEWLKKEMRELVITQLNKSRLQEFGILDSKIFLNEYEKFSNGKRTSITYEEILKVYMTELWLESTHKNFNVHEI